MDAFFTFLGTLPLDQISFGLLLTLTITGVMLGWLVPSRQVNARIGDKDKEMIGLRQERDDWKAAFFQSEAARAILTAQNSELLEQSKVTTHLLQSLRKDVGGTNDTHQDV